MLAYSIKLLRRVPKLLWESTDSYLTALGIFLLALTLFNRPLADRLGDWEGVSPWWSLVPVGLLLLYGLIAVTREDIEGVERERDNARNEKHAIEQERDALQAEKDTATRERDELRVAKGTIEQQHENLVVERNALMGELARSRNGDVQAQEKWRAQDALERYIVKMQGQILDEDKPLASLPYDDPRRAMARTWTLEILRRLDPDGKRDVVRFLYEHGLIKAKQPVISLRGADLTGANLARMGLSGSNLSGADLSGADLSGASFCDFHGSGASWLKAVERGGGWEDLMDPMTTSDLSLTKLRGAVLRRTLLCGSNLLGADFADAVFDGTDVRGGTNLGIAKNLTQQQIEQAYGSSGDQEYMPDTLLPDHLEAPEAWRKLLSQQQEDRVA